jgi:glycosyltransferase involved in cell wall biosynthesis
VVALGSVRILLDYRPALRQRTGVGEYVHELTRALGRMAGQDQISIFTSSWKDRPAPDPTGALDDVRIVDRRVPVRGLAWSWYRFEWPPIELLAGATDVVHAQTPLLIPATHAAQVVTIHDLDFLHHPERTVAEMQRDFPRLVREHARRADHVIVSSHYAARQVVTQLELDPAKVSVCSPGAPEWAHAIAQERATLGTLGTLGTLSNPIILFVGTIEPRKNLTALFEAYSLLRERRADAPPLVLAGLVRDSMQSVLERLERPPLAGHASVLGYVSDERRRALYRDAKMLVLPSFEEGFGLPVLEAMACGVPVVISDRGSLPEVAGDSATPVDAEDAASLADQMEKLLRPEFATPAIARGLAQAARYSWDSCAAAARDAYRAAVAARERRAR